MNTIRVLVVDDHPMMREALCTALEAEADMTVVGEATDGEQAVTSAADLDPDVIVMDLYLPRKDGVAAIEEIVARKPDAHIIVMTSSTEDNKVVAAVGAGAIGYLLKNAPRAEFIRGVREVACGRAFLPAEIAATLAREIHRKDEGSGSSTLHVEPLTPREKEVLDLLGEGLSNRAIAAALSLSESTVRVHVHNILGKLGLEDRNQAIVFALRQSHRMR